MKCLYCDYFIPTDSLFCPWCGQKVLHDCDKSIIQAVEQHDLKKIQALINDGVDLDSTDSNGNTALIIATKLNYYDIAKLLIDNGADITAKNNNGFDANTYAVGSITYLLSELYSERITQKNEKLIQAVEENDYLTVQRLLKNGANPNAKRSFPNCDTALMVAVKNNSYYIAKKLIIHGANVNANVWGNTALDYAKDPAIRNLLIDNGAIKSEN